MITLNTAISNNTPRSQASQKSAQPTFTATPIQIFDKLTGAKICPGKKAFLEDFATFFLKLELKMNKSEKLPKSFDYLLTEPNELPKDLAKTKIRTGFLSWTSVNKYDKKLAQKSFSCGGDSHCSCGKGKSLKEFASELLEYIGAPEPGKISLGKK